MPTRDKGTLVGALAADLGMAEAHTPGPADAGQLGMQLDGEAEGYARQPVAARKGGRPAGAANRTSLQVMGWLRAKGYRDPLEFLGAMISTDPVEILKASGCEVEGKDRASAVAKLVAAQVNAARELAQYAYQRQPAMVEVKTEGPRTLIVIADQAQPTGGPAIEGVLSAHEQYQEVSGPGGDRSHGGRVAR